MRCHPVQRMRPAGSDPISSAARQVCRLPTNIALSNLTDEARSGRLRIRTAMTPAAAAHSMPGSARRSAPGAGGAPATEPG
jgi:hypothetical protein